MLRVFARAICRSSSSMPSSLLRVSSSHLFSTSPSVSSIQQQPSSSLRRRRRRGSKATDNNNDNQSNNKLIPDDPSISSIDSSSTVFSPKDSKGNLLNSQEYLQLASLSPWVPCPDMVIKRVFEIANANTNDKHVDLGCGDGRLNFAAISTFKLRNSLGIDIDVNILEKCYERLGKRYVPSRFGRSSIGNNEEENTSSEADKLDFVQADLMRVIERQKTKYKELLSSREDTLSTSKKDDEEGEDWSKEDNITQQISQSTIITMYFVDEALQQIQPYLASVVGGRTDVCVITIGYEMKGWEPAWVERVLGLTIFKYDMINVANDPVEWSTTAVGNTEEYEVTKKDDNSDHQQAHLDTYTDVDESPELAAYLQKKRQQDIEELDNGLRIHHDDALNDFTQSRSLQQAQSSVTADSSSILYEGTDDEEDDDWDFDEDENPEELLKEAQQKMLEQRSGGRPKGMRAGLDETEKTKKKSKKAVWKKP